MRLSGSVGQLLASQIYSFQVLVVLKSNANAVNETVAILCPLDIRQGEVSLGEEQGRLVESVDRILPASGNPEEAAEAIH